MKRTRLSVLLAATLTARGLLMAADVPVKQIVLFSSGVGYFEHDGPIKDNDSTQLQFKAGQINDVLKSLVLQDTGNGKVGVITYPSQDPVDRALRSFQIDITSNPTLSQLLNQLRGAKVSLTAQTEKVSGTILGVETKRKPVDKGEPIEVQVLNLLAGATIRSIELDSINGLSLDDPQLQEELTKALATLAQSRDKDKKPVTINFQGQGERTVRIGYVVETPIWKTSYRLILSDDEKVKPRLQGWAIIENQTDNDWNGVNLSLVSGRPISFVMNLYSPLYIPRPVVTPELYASLRPQTYAEGLVADEAEAPPSAVAGAAPMMQNQQAANRDLRRELSDRARQIGGGGGMKAAALSSMADSLSKSMDATSSVSTVANATNLGDLFQYNVGSVSLARQNSAMLPIVTDDIEAERVSIYNASVLPRNPLTGARLKNTTGKSLLQGPITVLDKGVYAGDARIEDLPPGQQRLLSYGIDLQTIIDAPTTSSTDVLGGKIVKGTLSIERKTVNRVDYAMENKSDLDKTIIVELPVASDWTLVDSPKPEETTPAVYRFRAPVKKHDKAKLSVQAQNVSEEAIAILPADIDSLVYWTRHGSISKQVKDALIKAIQMRQAVVDFERQISDSTQRLETISTEQDRIRRDMNTVDHNAQYFQRLLSKLNDQESQIEKLQTAREEATQKRNDARTQLEGYLNSLDVG